MRAQKAENPSYAVVPAPAMCSAWASALRQAPAKEKGAGATKCCDLDLRSPEPARTRQFRMAVLCRSCARMGGNCVAVGRGGSGPRSHSSFELGRGAGTSCGRGRTDEAGGHEPGGSNGRTGPRPREDRLYKDSHCLKSARLDHGHALECCEVCPRRLCCRPERLGHQPQRALESMAGARRAPGTAALPHRWRCLAEGARGNADPRWLALCPTLLNKN